MDYPFYSAYSTNECNKKPAILPPPSLNHKQNYQLDKDYLPDQGLIDAVNAALLLGQPLLLTGEPGTGKTQLAYHLACKLGYQVLKSEIKSTTVARDLFYTYDALRHFQAIQLKESTRKTDYITYKALGLAILVANDFDKVKRIIRNIESLEFNQRSIVLIDEIDKASRDLPNDILNEIEKSYFRVPELGDILIEAPVEKQPILIFTSNSEKNLPDTFLRRCVYYNIPFPDESRLRAIVEKRLAAQIGDINQFLSEALALFMKLREGGLNKKPSIAELLNWLIVLRQLFKDMENPFIEAPEQATRTLSTLVKTAEDQKAAQTVLEQIRATSRF
jgi:MoxR-like ATPase